MDPEMIVSWLHAHASSIGMLMAILVIATILVVRGKAPSVKADEAEVPDASNDAVTYLVDAGSVSPTEAVMMPTTTASFFDAEATAGNDEDLKPFEVRVTVRRRVRRRNYRCPHNRTYVRVVGAVLAHNAVEALDLAWAKYSPAHAERNLRVWPAT